MTCKIEDSDKDSCIANLKADIQRLKETQKILVAEKEKYRLLVEDADVAYYVTDNKGVLIYLSPALETITGRPASELLGGHFHSFIHPDDAELAATAFIVTASGELGPSEFRIIKKDGEVCWIKSFSRPIYEKRKFAGLRGVIFDLTESKKREKEIRLQNELLEQLTADLSEKEATLRTILEVSGDGYYEVDLNGCYTNVNNMFCRILGYEEKELINHSFRKFTFPEMADRVFFEFNKVFNTGQPTPGFETVFIHKNGDQLSLELSISPVDNPAGRRIGFRGLVRNISERKKYEAAIRRSEEKYRALYDNATTGMFRVGLPEGMLLEINEVGARLFGYEDKEEMKKEFRPLEQYADDEHKEHFFSLIRDQGAVEGLVVPMLKKSGEAFFVELSAKNYPNENYLEGSFIDVTDRMFALKAIEESEKKYRVLFSSTSDLLITHDLTGRVIEVNPAVTQTIGRPYSSLVNHHVSEFMPDNSQERFHEEYLDDLIERGSKAGIFETRDSQGNTKYIEYKNVIIRPDKGEPYVTGIGRDVTDRLTAQNELRAVQDQLHQARKMQAVGTLSSGIAHDFNNILQAISGFVEIIQAKGGQDSANQRYLSEMKRAVDRASDLVTGLLTFSRKVKPELKHIDLNATISQAIGILERTIPKMISLEVDLEEGPLPIMGEAAQLQQILINLAANAKDAMPEGGRLLFETRRTSLDDVYCKAHLDVDPGDFIRLRVKDEGVGMDHDTVPHIFDPFFTTKEIGKGTGLGLSTVYGIVKGHNGHITCDSSPGTGTTFEILLPYPNQGSISPEVEEEEQPERSIHGDETILVVDDEKSILEIARECLEQHGYRVIAASSGELALQVYQEWRQDIELIVMDLGMPGMGGENCLKELISINPDVKVIIASGYSHLGQSGGICKLGAKGFVEKPYKLMEMLVKIREVLDNRG